MTWGTKRHLQSELLQKDHLMAKPNTLRTPVSASEFVFLRVFTIKYYGGFEYSHFWCKSIAIIRVFTALIISLSTLCKELVHIR